jgi:hypothetical protein
MVETRAFDSTTFGLAWKPAALAPWKDKLQKGSFPQYFKQVGKELMAVAPDAVPDATGLRAATFPAAVSTQTYTSPGPGDNVWHTPGPKAGPFTAKLSDGSIVTYYWYRFIDQPALRDADLSEAEKSRLQAIVEKIHAQWTLKKEYIPPPKIGVPAALDPALIVKPPRGLEIGYVPIAVRQSSL